MIYLLISISVVCLYCLCKAYYIQKEFDEIWSKLEGNERRIAINSGDVYQLQNGIKELIDEVLTLVENNEKGIVDIMQHLDKKYSDDKRN